MYGTFFAFLNNILEQLYFNTIYLIEQYWGNFQVRFFVYFFTIFDTIREL